MAGPQAGLFLLFSLCVSVGCVSGKTPDASFQEDLLARISPLEQQGIDQAGKMQSMEARMENQEKTIHEYKQRVAELEMTVAALRGNGDQSLSGGSQETQADGGEDTGVKTQQESVVSLVKGRSSKQRRVLVGDAGPVAFHAVIKHKTTITHTGSGADHKVVFPDVMLNLGGGYHNHQGTFIAPRPGVYLISTSILATTESANREISVMLMKNGNFLANAFADGSSSHLDQGSATVVTQQHPIV